MTNDILAIRFGFGRPATAPDAEAMLTALAGEDLAVVAWPGPSEDQVAAMTQAFQNARRDRDVAATTEVQTAALELAQRSARATFARAIGSADGFRERLVAFWADHFTVTARNPVAKLLPGLMVDQAIRPHVAGRFADMLRAVTTHPAMLTYLNQDVSMGPNSALGKKRKRGLNENLARELLELHTLGVGAGYGQDDVRELAELLTGLTVEGATGLVFDPKRAEPGAEAVLGVTYDGEGMEPIHRLLDDLARRPETARHIAGKLATHFQADLPDPDLVAKLEAEFLTTDGDLLALARVLVTHPTATSPALTKARQPFDFIVAALRALGVAPDAIIAADDRSFRRLALAPMGAMGQPFQAAPGPDGWPEAAEYWITPQNLAARINWAMRIPARLVQPLPDPRAFLETALGPLAGKDLIWAVSAAETARDGVGIVLASPEFNRR